MAEQSNQFTEQACKAASEAVGYAVARNVPEMLVDIERQMAIDPEDTTLTVGVSLVVSRLSEHAVNFKVRGVGWTCKRKHKDEDFPEATVDLDNPDIPGLLDGTGMRENQTQDKMEDGLEMDECSRTALQRVLDIAQELGADLYAPCWLPVPNWRNSIVKVGGDGKPEPRLVPRGMFKAVLEAADDGRNVVINGNGRLTDASVELLRREGFEVEPEDWTELDRYRDKAYVCRVVMRQAFHILWSEED